VHLDRAARPQLAGEADIGCCADAVKYAHLVLSRGIDAVDLAAHPNAASRAAATAAAYRGMRDASEAARLEHAGAGCDLDNPTVRIADAHEAMPTLPDATGDARQQYRPNHTGKNQVSSSVMVSRMLWVSGDGRVIRSWIQFGSALANFRRKKQVFGRGVWAGRQRTKKLAG
jgi:hypothetical protein